MLKTKDVTLNSGDVIAVTEITVEQAILLFTQTDDGGLNIKGYNLLFLATGLTAKDLLKLTETDIVNIWAACEEVHAFFFKLAKAINLPELLAAVIQALIVTSSDKSTSKLLSSLVPIAGLSQKSTNGATGILSRLAAGFKK